MANALKKSGLLCLDQMQMDTNGTNKMQKNATKMYRCVRCDYVSSVKSNYTKHLSTRKHQMDTNGNKKNAKNAKSDTFAVRDISSVQTIQEDMRSSDPTLIESPRKSIGKVSEKYRNGHKIPAAYNCSHCNFECANKTNYFIHLSTQKHNNKMALRSSDKHECKFCNKTYSYASGLFKHVSAKHPNRRPNDAQTEAHVLTDILKDNEQLRKTIIELSKTTQPSNTNSHNNNSHINSHNKTFNLNFFLNETCKDAMNISEFIETIKISLDELERMGENGFVKGIADIITNKLKGLALTKRPIHCSDLKRETLYVKDEDEWAKESAGNPKMKNLIQHVSHKNLGTLGEWREEHPDYGNPAAHESNRYQSLIAVICNSGGDSDSSNESIVKRVAKRVGIGKE